MSTPFEVEGLSEKHINFLTNHTGEERKMTVKGFLADMWLCFAVLGAALGALFPFYLMFELIVWLLK